MNKYLRNFLYILPVLLLGMSIFLSNRTNAQSGYWPWVDLAYPGYATNITANSAKLNGTLSYSNAMNATNISTQVWFEYYKWYGTYDTQKIVTAKQTINYNGGQEYPRFTFSADISSLEANTNYCVEAKATNSAGMSNSTALCFKTLASGSGGSGDTTNFKIVTKGTNGIGETWANLQGEIQSMTGLASVDYYFSYWKDGQSTIQATGIYKKTTTGTFDIQLNGLLNNTKYCFKAVGKNSSNYNQISEGSTLCFTTGANGGSGTGTGTNQNLSIETRNTNEYGSNWITFKGEILKITNTQRADYYFAYKQDGGAWKNTPTYQANGTGNVSVQVTNLEYNTRYCYKAVLKDYYNSNNTAEGSEICLNTGTSGTGTTNNNLSVQTLSTNDYGSNWITLKAEILKMSNTSKVDYYFSYRKDGGTWQSTGLYQATNTGLISSQINNLDNNARYCFKAIIRDYYSPSITAEGSEVCLTTGTNGTTNNQTNLNINTLPYDYIADTYAVLKGEITNMGNSSKVDYWFEYYKSGGQSYLTNRETKSSIGGFSNTIYGLTPDTLYCYKAMGANNYNANEWDSGIEYCFRTLRAGQTSSSNNSNNNNNNGQSYTICYRRVMIYVNIDGSSRRTVTTRGVGYNVSPSSTQTYDSEDKAKDYINSMPMAYNQCGGDTGTVNNIDKRTYYYCQNSTGLCVPTNSQYENATNCEYSLRTYLPGISTNVCFSGISECTKYCRKSSYAGGTGSTTSNSGSSNTYQANQYYYCQTSDNKCVITDGKYANTTICSQALSIYKPGVSTGICFETNDVCTKACGLPSTSQIKEPGVICASNETKVEVADFSEITDTARQFNGKLTCVSDKNTVVGFEYYGKSETAKEVKTIWIDDAKPSVGQEFVFNKKVEGLEPGIVYCYKAVAKITAGQTYYSEKEICYPEKQITIDDCKAVFESYITEPFNGVNDELYMALKDNCPFDMYVPGIADKEKGFANEIADMQDAYKKEKDNVSAQLKKASSRNGFVKFFIGPNYGAIKSVQKFVDNNKIRIQDAEKLNKSYNSQYSQMAIERINNLIEKENQEITDTLTKAGKGFSLFGWLFKIFS
jgi:hypothetical protein